MNDEGRSRQEACQLHPIGIIRRTDDGIHLEILEPVRPALKQLHHFSHVTVLWWPVNSPILSTM